MVFHVIGVWLLAAAIPLWIYRWLVYFKLNNQERLIFRRLIKRRYESAIVFALRIFGFLIALAAAVILLVSVLRYLKYGTLQFGAYRDTMRNRLYSGVDPVDQALDAFHYDQLLPVAILTTCVLLSVAFSLVGTAIRDIFVVRRLHRKLDGMRGRQEALK
jgi:hypothetical protein